MKFYVLQSPLETRRLYSPEAVADALTAYAGDLTLPTITERWQNEHGDGFAPWRADAWLDRYNKRRAAQAAAAEITPPR